MSTIPPPVSYRSDLFGRAIAIYVQSAGGKWVLGNVIGYLKTTEQTTCRGC
jgi:hypothetical protein